MFNIEPTITAHRQDTEGHRIDRLNQVLGYACALADAAGNPEIWSSLDALHGKEGKLTVTWHRPVQLATQDFLRKAWEARGEHEIEHVVIAS